MRLLRIELVMMSMVFATASTPAYSQSGICEHKFITEKLAAGKMLSVSNAAIQAQRILNENEKAVLCFVDPTPYTPLPFFDRLDKANTVTAIILSQENSELLTFQEQKPPLSRWRRTTPIVHTSLNVSDLISNYQLTHPNADDSDVAAYVNTQLIDFVDRYVPALLERQPMGSVFVGNY